MKKPLSLCIIILILFLGCDYNQEPIKFEILSSKQTGITFSNDIHETPDFNPINYIYIYNGAGVGTGDINNDGLPDLFFAGNQVRSRLYLNKGNMEFEDITESAGILKEGWATGISFIDINADGLMDIYVCIANKDASKSENQLYINQGNNVFKEEAKAYGLNDSGYSTQAAFFDYDRDGDLDMYLLTNGMEDFNHNNMRPINDNGQGISTDRLYQNNGNNTFTNISREAGITIEGYGLGIGIMDVNNDGWPDIYCSNDFITNDLLWINNADGTFTNDITKYITQTSHNGMGIDIADYNNDGLMDIMQVDMLPETNLHNKTMTPAMNYNNQTMRYGMGYMPQYVRNTLQIRNKDASFSEIGRLAGIHKTDWSWAPLMADLDNDGLKDLFISNGYARDITDQDYTVYSQGSKYPFGTPAKREKRAYDDMIKLPSINLPNYFYKNEGDFSFKDVTKTWTKAPNSMSNGTIYVDLDGDGDLDLVTNNINDKAYIYKNRTMETNPERSNYLSTKLRGHELNPGGLGAIVTLYYGDTIQKAQEYPVRGYTSSVDYVLHFGLGKRKVVDSLQVIWPNDKSQTLKNIKANRRIDLSYADAKPLDKIKTNKKNTLLVKADNTVSQIVHKENPYIDFQDQPLLLKMLSREGPGLAVGDFNNDGLDDIFMSTAVKDTSYIRTQTADGSFTKAALLPNSWKYEQQGCVLADFNNDGRSDLYVASGGNELPYLPQNYQDQLYLQTQDGTFEISDGLPQINSSTSTVNAADYDGDGDLDLFVGSRLKPGSYPESDRNYILQNTNGTFIDVTSEVAPELAAIGMVTSALWTDFNNDGHTDLIVVGEWMEISFFENQNGKLKDVSSKSGVAGLSGFWNSINGADFDHDGDIDYIVGNFGENTDLKASKAEPLTIVAKDFDENGKIDAVIGYYVDGINYPLPPRDALISQIANMKKRFPFYKDYGHATFDQVFKEKELLGAIRKQAVSLKTIYLENNGDGTFSYSALPLKAQMAPVYGISIADLDADGHFDIVLTGNRRDTETLGGSLDGSIGTVLLGNSKGEFRDITVDKSGFATPGDSRGTVKLITNDSLVFLVANNDSALQCFSTGLQTKTISIKPTDTYATIELSNGKTYRQEFYYGSGYLTQDSRKLLVPPNAVKIIIFNSKNECRDGLETVAAR